MKTFYNLLAVLAIPGFLVFYSFVGGSPGGKTGSPGDGSNCTGCHAGTPQNVGGWIRSDIPEGGYVPGETYTITAKGMHEGVAKFGFELTAENAAGAKKGTFAVTDVVKTQLLGGGSSVTHTSGGNMPAGDSINWSMDWTAPDSGSGQVRFYSATNAANGNGGNSGDVIYLTMLSVEEDITISVAEHGLQHQISMYPNPASNVLNVQLPEGSDLLLFDIQGREVERRSNVKIQETLDISQLQNGLYFVRVTHNGETHTSRLLKN